MRRTAAAVAVAVLAAVACQELDEPDPVEVPSQERVVLYSNCDEVRAAGAAPIRDGDRGYRTGLDRDGDGVACEN